MEDIYQFLVQFLLKLLKISYFHENQHILIIFAGNNYWENLKFKISQLIINTIFSDMKSEELFFNKIDFRCSFFLLFVGKVLKNIAYL